MTPGTYDFSIVLGTTTPFRVRFKNSDGAEPPVLTNIDFDSAHLSIYNGTKPVADKLILRLETGVDAEFVISDALEAEVTWTPTPEQSRLIPVGEKAHYELEIRNGASQEVYLMGTITGIGGLNDD